MPERARVVVVCGRGEQRQSSPSMSVVTVHRAARARLRGVAVGARYAYVIDTAPRVPVTAAGRRALVALLDVADAPPHRHAHVQAEVGVRVQTMTARA
jgi:DUF1009 family protein